LCGFIDRSFIPPCLGGQPGYAAAFNQTVQLTRKTVASNLGLQWEGKLQLPEGYDEHKLTLYRGTENTGDGCQGAQLNLTRVATPSTGCAGATFTRNYNSGDLPGYSTWTFGAQLDESGNATQLRLLTLRNLARTTATCQITFG
jgi:hypothetical protein